MGSRPRIERYRDHTPVIEDHVWVDPDAVVIGEVRLRRRANVWPGVVLRGDQGGIDIGAETSIQDGTVAHATLGRSVTRVGARCTVGHRVILHGCTVEDDCLIGMGDPARRLRHRPREHRRSGCGGASGQGGASRVHGGRGAGAGRPSRHR